MKIFLIIASMLLLLGSCVNRNEKSESSDVKDLSFFLNRLYTLDHLPELEDSHTAMASTWDSAGLNNDGWIYRGLKDSVYVILDIDGPGCINRIFTGRSYLEIHETNFQVFIDGNNEPLFDLPVSDLFDPARSPFPYPLASNKTYPGILFPIPFEKHIKVQLYSPVSENWGNYWQITYTKYSENTRIKSISFPFSKTENDEIRKVTDAWLYAEQNAPEMPEKWSFEQKLFIKAGEKAEINLNETGIIRQMYITASPNISETWKNTRLTIFWDASDLKSVDVPLGYLFGNADYASLYKYNSIISGITDNGGYTMFPMPFNNGAKMVFDNRNIADADFTVRLDIEKRDSISFNLGRFHATFREVKPYGSGYDSLPRFGKSPKPFFVTLDTKRGPGKYVGTQLHIAWPIKTQWWGEGDWLIWTDEGGFPPSYHGTGTEEYFNSGWCFFDRKAVSGYIKMRPGNVNVYSYHLNDAFQFSDSIKTSVEIWWWQPEVIKSMWGATAFWYAYPIQDAGSIPDLLHPRLIHNGNTRGEMGEWEY